LALLEFRVALPPRRQRHHGRATTPTRQRHPGIATCPAVGPFTGRKQFPPPTETIGILTANIAVGWFGAVDPVEKRILIEDIVP
jgi:hypothetical protein